MSDLITIAYYNSADAAVSLLKARLESEGIHCYVKNQFAAFRRGGGRAELQINSADYEIALPILKETGFYKPEENIPDSFSPFLKKFDEKTKNIPLLKIFSKEMRLFIITLVILGTFSTLLYFKMQLTTEEIMTKHSWCVEKIKYNGRDTILRTTGLVIIGNDGCKEKIRFPNYNVIDLPGINSPSAHGKWAIYENEITISEVEKNAEIFEGTYNLKFSNNNNDVVMQSNHTTIYLHAGSW
jgi:hypothetical protein